MAFLFRKIQDKRFWDKPSEENLTWLPQGQIPASPLTQLRLTDDSMSIYEIEDIQDGVNRVVAALAATRDHLDKLDYLIFEKSLLEGLGIDISERKGTTADDEVNQWHLDLENLTTKTITKLVDNLFYKCETGRKTALEIKDLISNHLEEGFLNPGQVRIQINNS